MAPQLIRLLVVLGLLLWAAESAASTVPKVISYQGVLTDTEGTVVPDDYYDLTFAVFDQPGLGSPVESWSLTVNVEAGLYNVMLTEGAVPFSQVFDGSPRYMEVTIVAGGGLSGLPVVLAPRHEIASVPYALTAGNVLGASAVPAGVIAMWSGDETDVPAGWALCDGQNGTPDLRGRFVVGLDPGGDPDYQSPNATGGSKAVQLDQSTLPGHSHEVVKDDPNGNQMGWSNDQAIGNNRRYLPQGTNTNPNTNSIFTNNVGGGQAHENRPPYWVLAFIMKL